MHKIIILAGLLLGLSSTACDPDDMERRVKIKIIKRPPPPGGSYPGPEPTPPPDPPSGPTECPKDPQWPCPEG